MSDRLVFPDGFAWGAATSAYQIEGAVAEGGRTPSIWDTYSHMPGATFHGDNGDIACDNYHRLESDVALMAELGLRAYRFSVAWPRVQPDAKGGPNQDGLDHYRRLVEMLDDAGIEPMVTLYHWDLPQPLADAGGWTRRDTAQRFADYVAMVSEALSDRVRLWVTINEPWVEAFLGYGDTLHAPGRGEIGAGVLASHHLLLGHGLAARALSATASQPPEVGIALDPIPVSPASRSKADADAARRVEDQRNRWFIDPILGRGYPKALLGEYVALLGEEFVREGDVEVIGADLGFLALNYYSPSRVAAGKATVVPDARTAFRLWLNVEDRARPEVPVTSKGWTIEPEGLTDLLVGLKNDYGDIPMYVTENGAAFNDYVGPDGEVRDPERVDYLRRHFIAAHRAIEAGVDLRGYFVWSLYDNFEWSDGYSQRFGIVFTDYRTQARIKKQSALFYRDVITANAVEP